MTPNVPSRSACDLSLRFQSAPWFFRNVAVDFDLRIRQQHARGGLRSARHRWVVADQVLRNRTIDQKRQLRRKALRIGHLEPHQQITKPDAAALLERDRDLLDGPILAAEIGTRVDGRAAPKVLARTTLLQRISCPSNLLTRRTA